MSSESEEAIITFPIKFVVDAQSAEDVKKEADELADSKESGQPTEGQTGEISDETQLIIEDLIKEKTEGLEGITEDEKTTIEGIAKFVEQTDKQGLKNLAAFAKNPQAAIQGKLLGILGKASIIGAIALMIIQSPELIKAVVQALAIKGGPLNQDYHRFFEDETQTGISRNLQYRRAVGLDVIITSDNRGFILEDPAFVGNNLVDADTTRALRTSPNSTKYGYVNSL
jgi:hypothetical protein